MTSFGPHARIYTLANAIVSQAVDDAPAFKSFLSTKQAALESGQFRIGCIIAN